MSESIPSHGATAIRYLIRVLQLLIVLLALYLILTPLFNEFSFVDGLAWTIIGIAALIFAIVLEAFARGASRLASWAKNR